MRKFISVLLTFVFALSTVAGTAITVNASSAILSGDYKFVDIAYSPSLDMYVAAAKGGYTNLNRTYETKLYTSKDRINWTESFALPDATSNFATVLNQNIEWWDDQQKFVAYASAKLYFSSDGLTWTENSAAQRADGGIVVKDGQLVVSGGRALRIAKTPSEYTQVIYAVSFYPTVVGVSKLRADNTKKYIMASNDYVYSFEATYSGTDYSYPTYEMTTSDAQLANTNSAFPYDFVYNDKRDEWILIFGGTNLKIFRGSSKTNYGATMNISGAANDSPITAAYINDNYIFIGLANGRVYRTPNTSEEITSSAVWTEVENKKGTTAMSEQVTCIKEGASGDFVISTETKMYLASAYEYMDSSEYVFLGVPEVIGVSPFKNVKLIGGVYSPELNKYVVYGNSTLSEEVNKAVVFTSTDGLNWVKKNVGQPMFLDTANGAVWWSAKSKFILSASTMATSGASYSSSDGETWSYIGDPLFGLYAELAVAGDTLYSTNGGKVLYEFTDLTLDGRTPVDLSSIATVAYTYHTKIAASNQADPKILTVASYIGLVRNNEAAGTELEKWTYKTNVTTSGAANDMKYIDSIGKFLIAPRDKRMTIVDKIGTVESGPANPSNMYTQYFDTNGSKFVFGANNSTNLNDATAGALYKTNDSASFGSGSAMSLVPLSQVGCLDNTMPITNIFTDASGKFFATVSDRTNSDVLIVNASADGYIKVSDNIKINSVSEGDRIAVRIKYTNKPNATVDYKLITAIYENYQLKQITANDVSMLGQANGYLTQEVTVDSGISENATLKVFLWDDLNNINPVTTSTDFFQ